MDKGKDRVYRLDSQRPFEELRPFRHVFPGRKFEELRFLQRSSSVFHFWVNSLLIPGRGKSRAGRRGSPDGTAAGHDADLFLKASVALQHGVEQYQIGAEIEYITDMARIMEYGIMSTPALMIDDRIVSMGRVLKTKDVLKYL